METYVKKQNIKYWKKNIIFPFYAEAIGSKYKKKFAGTLFHISLFFHGTKTITTGEGGMIIIITKDFMRKSFIN